jgi:hypothetical protein
MIPQPLEYASPPVPGRRPWWVAQVAAFSAFSFAFGMALLFTYSHYHTPDVAEIVSEFSVLCIFQTLLSGYSTLAMGLMSFVRTRQPCVAVPRASLIALLVAIAYGAFPATWALACDALDGWSAGIVLLILAAVIPILLPFVLLRRTANWPV